MRMINMHGGGEIIGYLPMLGASKSSLWQHMRGDIFQDRRCLGHYALLSDQSRNATLRVGLQIGGAALLIGRKINQTQLIFGPHLLQHKCNSDGNGAFGSEKF